MSSSRSDKYKDKRTYEIVKAERKEVEKALIGVTNTQQTIYTYSDEVVPRLNYPIEALKNLIETNGYASLCVNKFSLCECGKGYNEINDPQKNLFPTDKWIIENIDIDELVETSISAKSYGEFYWDVAFYKGEAIGLYHCPVSTMLKGTGKKSGQYVQYFGIKGKETWYPALDLDEIKKGNLGTGHYIYHWKRGTETYGVPDWIAGQMEVMTSKEQRRTILSHFLNDAMPDGVGIHYGLGGNVDTKMVEDYKTKHEKYLQGSENRGKTDQIFRNETQLELGKAFEYIQIQKEIITAVGLQMSMQTKQDIVAFFQMPSFLVGIPTKSGWSEQEQYIMQDFISNIIQSEQRRHFYKPFSKLFPGMICQLNTIEMPKLSQEKNQDVTIDTVSKASEIVKAVMNTELEMNRELKLKEKQE